MKIKLMNLTIKTAPNRKRVSTTYWDIDSKPLIQTLSKWAERNQYEFTYYTHIIENTDKGTAYKLYAKLIYIGGARVNKNYDKPDYYINELIDKLRYARSFNVGVANGGVIHLHIFDNLDGHDDIMQVYKTFRGKHHYMVQVTYKGYTRGVPKRKLQRAITDKAYYKY